jgi:hypothetical protein
MKEIANLTQQYRLDINQAEKAHKIEWLGVKHTISKLNLAIVILIHFLQIK